ncbi:class I SAM-dependent methyltransferase [Parashewanella spongiae]|uniref:Class I SAM-dependent methyltransferase n=1 Tax=Parashewanella spongiae TaxID=342950 RepID=A0A3A6U2M6_9GAMM|nr:class I SAM-dependent methyltransferase [Parashewanella spongiae]MCL1077529.1 class I SAM-dependent methyltransferase [Parashewanella spongiae]RJY18269.1 class I SAM-dependent methyltransferase [Parashewanella spongiae]
MKLNEFEKTIVQHPLRCWAQDKIEMPIITSLFDIVPQYLSSALEIGCGYGNGVGLIRKHFFPESLTAVDYDIEMVKATKARYADEKWLSVSQADASQLPFENNNFDLIFNFAVFHHIPDWQKAVKEVYRVLKPNGFFVVEDLYRLAITNPVSKRLFEHPQHNRFDHHQFLEHLTLCGFKLVKSHHIFNLAGVVLAQKVVHH